MSRRVRPVHQLSTIFILGLVAALAGAGLGFAAITVTYGTATTSGFYISGTGLTYFLYGALGTSKIPNPVPTEAGTTAAAPVRLPTSTSVFVIGSATAGAAAVVVTLNETTAAPSNQEIEIAFTVAVGGSPTQSTVKGYVETQHPHTGAFTYYFYYQTSATTATVILIESVTELTSACSAVGTCP
jgi:hypothetical protein